MTPGEAIYREITGGRSPRTEITGWRDGLAWLRGQAGSTSALARELGVNRSTLRGWLDGRTPRGDRAGMVARAALRAQRRARLPKGREKRLRAPGSLSDVKMVGSLNYGTEPEPERDLNIGDYLADIQNDLVDAYLDGASTDELADILAGGIEDADFYADTLSSDGSMDWDITSMDGWA